MPGSSLPFRRCHACSPESNAAFEACPECGVSFETAAQQAADAKLIAELGKRRDDELRDEKERALKQHLELQLELDRDEDLIVGNSRRRRHRRPRPSGPLITDSNYRAGTMLAIIGFLIGFIGLALAITDHGDKARLVGPVGLALFIAGILWNLLSKTPPDDEPKAS